MISSVDIQNKMFSRSVRGYKEDEVDDFLTLLAEDVDINKLNNSKYMNNKTKILTDESYSRIEDKMNGFISNAEDSSAMCEVLGIDEYSEKGEDVANLLYSYEKEFDNSEECEWEELDRRYVEEFFDLMND